MENKPEITIKPSYFLTFLKYFIFFNTILILGFIAYKSLGNLEFNSSDSFFGVLALLSIFGCIFYSIKNYEKVFAKVYFSKKDYKVVSIISFIIFLVVMIALYVTDKEKLTESTFSLLFYPGLFVAFIILLFIDYFISHKIFNKKT